MILSTSPENNAIRAFTFSTLPVLCKFNSLLFLAMSIAATISLLVFVFSISSIFLAIAIVIASK